MNPTRIIIIGGVAGGASAAARARRHSEEAQITLIESGPDVSFANCGLPYHIGGEIPDRGELAIQTPDSLRTLLNLDVRTLFTICQMGKTSYFAARILANHGFDARSILGGAHHPL